jgi:hypothetical protein
VNIAVQRGSSCQYPAVAATWNFCQPRAAVCAWRATVSLIARANASMSPAAGKSWFATSHRERRCTWSRRVVRVGLARRTDRSPQRVGCNDRCENVLDVENMLLQSMSRKANCLDSAVAESTCARINRNRRVPHQTQTLTQPTLYTNAVSV